MSVQEYLDKHTLSRKLEDAVNAAVRAKTSDPVLFISNHMKKGVQSVITKVKARQILDSRGIPTVEVDLYTNKAMFRSSVPSGNSTGMYEAVELRDGDKGVYLGNGVAKAVKNINDKISEALIGMDPTLQSQIDHAMIDLDKTEKKGELGANAILAVSIAACKAGAAEKEVPLYKHIADLSGKANPMLPVPAFTVISGGRHAGNNLAIEEIMILPIGASRFEEALRMGSETYHHLKNNIKFNCVVLLFSSLASYNDLDPMLLLLLSLLLLLLTVPIAFTFVTSGRLLLQKNLGHITVMLVKMVALLLMSPGNFREALDLVKEAIGRAGYDEKIKIALDVAATNFCIGKRYDLDFQSPQKSGQDFKSAEDMMELYRQLCVEYPIVSIEDPFDKEDWEHFKDISSLAICQ
ncbi:cytosolic enolase 3-like protein, partial [Trifolium pratense]